MRGEEREKRKRGEKGGGQKPERRGEVRGEIEEVARGEIRKMIRKVGLGRGERRKGKEEIKKEEFRDADDTIVAYAVDCHIPAHGGVTVSSYVHTVHTTLDNCAYSNSTLVPPTDSHYMFTLHRTHPLTQPLHQTHPPTQALHRTHPPTQALHWTHPLTRTDTLHSLTNLNAAQFIGEQRIMKEHVALHGPGGGGLAPHKVCPNCRVIPMVGPPHCLLHWEANVHRRALLRLVSGICLSVGREGTGKGGWEGGREGGRGWGREELERLVEGGIWEKVRCGRG